MGSNEILLKVLVIQCLGRWLYCTICMYSLVVWTLRIALTLGFWLKYWTSTELQNCLRSFLIWLGGMKRQTSKVVARFSVFFLHFSHNVTKSGITQNPNYKIVYTFIEFQEKVCFYIIVESFLKKLCTSKHSYNVHLLLNNLLCALCNFRNSGLWAVYCCELLMWIIMYLDGLLD